MVNETLLAASWILSLAFVFSLGVNFGYRQAHTDRMQFIDGIKGGVLQLIEKVKANAQKEISDFRDSLGGPDNGRIPDTQEK
jgi:hypothetical protein